MAKQENCDGCTERHRCQEVYRQLGRAEVPSVVSKVLTAFLLPIAVFIGVLAAFEKTLARVISKEELRTICGFLSALAAAFVCVQITRVVKKRFKQR